MLKLQGFTG